MLSPKGLCPRSASQSLGLCASQGLSAKLRPRRTALDLSLDRCPKCDALSMPVSPRAVLSAASVRRRRGPCTSLTSKPKTAQVPLHLRGQISWILRGKIRILTPLFAAFLLALRLESMLYYPCRWRRISGCVCYHTSYGIACSRTTILRYLIFTFFICHQEKVVKTFCDHLRRVAGGFFSPFAAPPLRELPPRPRSAPISNKTFLMKSFKRGYRGNFFLKSFP